MTTLDPVAEALAEGERLRRRFTLALLGLTVLLAALATVGMSMGSVSVPFRDVWSTIGHHLTGTPAHQGSLGTDAIIWQIRCPRVVLGALVGAGLAVVGVAVQAMVRNPLADPYVLGVESGASAAAVAVIYFGGVLAAGVRSPAVGAFFGALGTIVVVFMLARTGGRVSSVRLLLVGVSLSYALSAFTSFVLYSTRDAGAQSQIMFWILGSLGGATWSQIPLVAGAIAFGFAYLWHAARRLNALALGDESATALGMDADRLRVRLFVVCSLIVAVIVATAGPIGFVGLVVPHVARMLVGADHRRVLPTSLLLGATYLVGVDIVARTLVAPGEIPIGVVTAMIGTPFFLWLIRRRGSTALMDTA